MNEFVGVLWKFGVVDFFEFVEGQFEGIDFMIELFHEFLGVSRFVELEYFVVELDSFFFVFGFLLLLDVLLVGSFFANVFIHENMCVHV